MSPSNSLLQKLSPFDAIGVQFQMFLNLNQNLKLDQINFYCKFFNIHAKEEKITCHDYYGFKLG
jgi:hypothetical protein